jgi:hypothetical protein
VGKGGPGATHLDLWVGKDNGKMVVQNAKEHAEWERRKKEQVEVREFGNIGAC